MLEWVLAGLLCIVTYVVFTLSTSSGSQYEDNSIDAFISKGLLLSLQVYYVYFEFYKTQQNHLNPKAEKNE